MPGLVKGPQTLYDKVFSDHIVDERDDGTILLYIGEIDCIDILECTIELTIGTDRHLVHEVTSPVRFAVSLVHYLRCTDCRIASV